MRRRAFLSTACAGAMAASATRMTDATAADALTPSDSRVQGKGQLKQSVMGWCFNPMDPLVLAREAKEIGLVAIEGIPSKHYPAVREMGLQISLVGSHGFKTGPVDPENHAEVEAKLRESIDLAVKHQSPSVITFTGMTVKGMQDEVAMANCIRCWKKILPYAEANGITLVLEHLNSVDDSHPMKGHPGYFGDDLHRCVDLVKQMDSANFRLLFDVYHVQIMHGDLIRNIRRYAPFVGHYHTAGNPGRGELDETQEINYPAVIKEIVATGFEGFLAQEFIPTSEDPMASLRQAYQACLVT